MSRSKPSKDPVIRAAAAERRKIVRRTKTAVRHGIDPSIVDSPEYLSVIWGIVHANRRKPSSEITRRLRDQWRNFRKLIKRRGIEGRGRRIPAGFLQSLLDRPCPYCGADLGDDYHLDHIIPVSAGGPNEPWNIQATCPPCNMMKSDTPPWLFATKSAD